MKSSSVPSTPGRTIIATAARDAVGASMRAAW